METLNYLDAQGKVNFYLVDWLTLNKWLSHLNGHSVDIKLPEGLNRGDIIKELEERRKSSNGDKLRRFAGAIAQRDLGHGKDWREFENEQGMTHLEELFLHQPKDWRKQAREYFFAYKVDIVRKSSSKTLRTHPVNVVVGEDDNGVVLHAFLSTPILMVLLHPDLRRVDRYGPLNFLLSYGATDPLPELTEELCLTKDVKEALYKELSPLDYFFEFQKTMDLYTLDLPTKIGKAAKVPRLPLINELDFSKIIGQRLAKSMIRREIVTYFWNRCSNKDGALIRQPLSMVFAGPSGNGKTELAMEVAELLNRPNDNAFLKIDCGKLTYGTEIFGLSGAYQGAYEGSALNNFIVSTSAEPNKIGVVLLDEFDKVKEEVVKGFYQVFDKGEWTNKLLRDGSDSQTSVIPCHNIIFIMTVNAADNRIVQYASKHASLYTAESVEMVEHEQSLESLIRNSLQGTYPFTKAFVGRIGSFVPFVPMAADTSDDDSSLLKNEMMTVAKLLIEREKDNIEIGSDLLHFEQSLSAEVKDKMARTIVRKANPEAGVRSIQQWVTKDMGQRLMHECLLARGGIARNSEIQYNVDRDEERISFRMIGLLDSSQDYDDGDGASITAVEESDIFG